MPTTRRHEAERAVAHPEPARGQQLAAGLEELRHPVPRQPPRPSRSRRHCARPTFHKVSGGTSFLTAPKSRTCARGSAPVDQQRRRPGVLRAWSTTPKRGIGHTTLAALGAFATQHKPEPVWCAVQRHAAGQSPAPWTAASLADISDLEYSARHVRWRWKRRAFAWDWLKGNRLRTAPVRHERQRRWPPPRWGNVMEFCDWMAQRAGRAEDAAAPARQTKSLLEVSQTIALLSTISEREQDRHGDAVHPARRPRGWSGPVSCWWA